MWMEVQGYLCSREPNTMEGGAFVERFPNDATFREWLEGKLETCVVLIHTVRF